MPDALPGTSFEVTSVALDAHGIRISYVVHGRVLGADDEITWFAEGRDDLGGAP